MDVIAFLSTMLSLLATAMWQCCAGVLTISKWLWKTCTMGNGERKDMVNKKCYPKDVPKGMPWSASMSHFSFDSRSENPLVRVCENQATSIVEGTSTSCLVCQGVSLGTKFFGIFQAVLSERRWCESVFPDESKDLQFWHVNVTQVITTRWCGFRGDCHIWQSKLCRWLWFNTCIFSGRGLWHA